MGGLSARAKQREAPAPGGVQPPSSKAVIGFVARRAIGLFVTLFLPWYQETVIAPGTTDLRSASVTLTGWGAFSFVEAAGLVVAAGGLTLLFARAGGGAVRVGRGGGAGGRGRSPDAAVRPRRGPRISRPGRGRRRDHRRRLLDLRADHLEDFRQAGHRQPRPVRDQFGD